MNWILNEPSAWVSAVPWAISCEPDCGIRQAEAPVPPVGIADLADDAIADLGPAHRRPGIGHGLAFKLDLAAQPGGGLRARRA